jgi:hypothetical protein
MTFLKDWALVACTAVNLYLLGVMVIFATVTYPQFGAVDRSTFPVLYQAFNARIGLPVVTFEFLAALLVLPLYVARSERVPLWSVHLLLALSVAYFAITFAWHLPAHRPLAAGDNSGSAMGPMIASQWARTVVQVGRAVFCAWLGVKVAGSE